MAFEQREIRDYFSTSLIVAASITDTTMRASAFTGLPNDYGSKYLPLVLHDDAQGIYEMVAVVSHATSSDTVTVVRGREGTSAKAWPAGTRIECAPARYDALIAATSSTLPPDPHIGMRVSRLDLLDVIERANGVWAPSVGVSLASEAGPRRSGTIPAGAAIMMRGGHKSGTTGSGGTISLTHAVPFPNATIATIVTVVNSSVACVATIAGESASGASLVFVALATGNAVASGVTVSYQYLSIGY